MRATDSETRLDHLRAAVADRVLTSLTEVMAAHEEVGPEIGDLGTVAADMLAGGKRLRASFAAAGWMAFGGADLDDRIIAAGAGLELFQMAALVHDDVIDDSHTRRGRPAAHRQLATRHHQLSMVGDADRFGASAAVLLGDLLVVASTRELDDALDRLPDSERRSARRIVTDMMAGVTFGQYLDIYAQSAPWADDPTVDLDRARRVLRAKAARYSVEQPLCLGATMAGAPPAGVRACAEIGLPIGEAFQLRDDLLGVFGDPALTGKPAGDDLREGKRTVLIATTLQRAGTEAARELRHAIGNPELDADALTRAREIIVATGAPSAVEALIAERTSEGLAAIASAPLTKPAADALRALAAAAVSRTA
ncbi:polyprenyl synthetase family protein [Ruania halotolerans]|uniref:polyprenyl synthetase family protein n=1 Tax=Ruania halotolerans TaxID=2897773 RepID=UPI001E529BB3|nr:polyprenyl synthetase family protein [Ruania halotolerans]UFU04819.1 polyprenyl synthetase family protein [Ruania halotolerans]